MFLISFLCQNEPWIKVWYFAAQIRPGGLIKALEFSKILL